MNDASVGVLFGDSGGFQIPIHDPQQTRRDFEDPVATIAVGDPSPQFGGQIRPDRQRRTLPVLFVAVIQLDERDIAERQIPANQSPQFIQPQPGQNRRLVDQSPFGPEPFQRPPAIIGNLGKQLAFVWPSVNRHGVFERSPPGGIE